MLSNFFSQPRLQTFGIACATSFAASALADEGMWLFNAPPLKQLKEKYQFEPTPQWLEHLQKASVRFNSGGSGSFVSANGLVITNHHVGADTLQKIGDAQHNYLRDGFYAKRQADEIKSTDLELNVLMSIEDVTARVNGAVKSGMTSNQASSARNAAIAAIEKESKDKTGLRSDVVTLYQGGAYHLYRYKRYDDVRLVFAPEQQMAFFGGDPDNFTYPRHDLDFAIFRVYEDGQPIRSDQYLKWNAKGAGDQELVFVTGHPASTDRDDTVAELETERDVIYPASLKVVRRRVAALRRYSSLGAEQARQANSRIFGLENALKAYTGEYSGLTDPKILAKKSSDEKMLRDQVAKKPEWQAKYGSAWAT